MRRLLAITVTLGLLVLPSQLANAHITAAPLVYKNCTNLNKRYPHGVGLNGARDHTSDVPVTNFRRSIKIYKQAMSFNRGLDRDKDGIACEAA